MFHSGHIKKLSWFLLWQSGWIRVGEHIAYYRINTSGEPSWLYFSERHGYTKFCRFGRLVLGWY